MLDQAYEDFFKWIKHTGAFPYTLDRQNQRVHSDGNAKFKIFQRFNLTYIWVIMLIHSVLILISSNFLRDINQVNLLTQLPWIVGLPLSMVIAYNEIYYRREILTSLTMWVRLEKTVLGSEVAFLQLKRQEKFVTIQTKAYTLMWVNAILSFFIFFWAVPRFPGFPTFLIDPKDYGTVFDWAMKITFGLAEPYMINVYWTTIAGFDVLVGSICYSTCCCIKALHQQLLYQNIRSKVSPSRPNLFNEVILKYRSLELLVTLMNSVFSNIIALQKGILLVLQGIMLYGSITYVSRLEVFIPYCSHFVFFNFRVISLFMPIGMIYRNSDRFLQDLKSFVKLDRLDSKNERRMRKQLLSSCKVLCLYSGQYYPIKPTTILSYVCFLTTYIAMIVMM